MLITASALDALNTGFNLSFKDGLGAAKSQWSSVAMLAPSVTRGETYGWLSQLPRMREWIGDRAIKSVKAFGYTILNRDFEATIEVARNDIEDDQLGVYAPAFQELGRGAAELPDELIFGLLKNGFSQRCYDGQFFFDTGHPVGNDYAAAVVSNYQGGAGEAWYMLDTSRAVRPFIYQERKKPQLVGKIDPTDNNVFLRRNFLYGVDMWANAGFGLWQLAYASRAPLDATNYAAVRAAMSTQRGDEGRLLGVRPSALVCSPNLEERARTLLSSATIAGSSNPWVGSAELIVTPWLAD